GPDITNLKSIPSSPVNESHTGSIRLQGDVFDGSGISSVKIGYGYDGTIQYWKSYSGHSGNTYWYDIPRSEWSQHVGDTICWRIHAYDNDNDVPSDEEDSYSSWQYVDIEGSNNPQLYVHPTLHNFGTMDKGQTASWTFYIENSGGGTLSWNVNESLSWVTSISPSSGTTTTETDSVTVNIDTSSLSQGQHYDGYLSVTSDGGSEDVYVEVTISGGGEPDFTISATPSSGTVVQGGSTTYTVSLTSQNGFSSSVSLSISGLPSGCTHNFNPDSVTPTGSSTLTVTTSTSTPTGTYTLTITGTGGGKTHSTQIELIVNESGSDPQIIMDSYSINYDSINNDGTVGPGEYAYFSITLENIGGSTAGGVTASIQTDDSYVDHYSTYSVSFGDITVGNTASSSSYDFYLHVSEACTDGHVIPFNITITDSQSHQWSDSFEITVIDNIGPSAYDCQVSPKITSKGSKVNISVYAEDSAGIRSVKALIKKSGDIIKLLTLYDDGNHNDGSSGDGIFGNSWTTLSEENDYVVDIRTTDNLGNMRYYAGMQGFTTKQWNKKSKILMVLDYQSSDTWIAYYYESALAENGYKYDTWLSFYRGAPNSSILNQYIDGVVIWSVPSYYNVELENSTVQSTLESYLNSGGNLFISGQDIGYLTEHGDITSNFYNNYLHATYVQDDTGLYTLNGVSGDPISNGITLDISGGAGNQSWPSEIDPISPAVTIFTYNASSSASLEKTIPEIPFEENKKISAKVKAISSSGSGAIRVNTGTYKVVYFAFGFEGINSYDTRANLMGRIMSWLGLSSSTDTISITVKNQSNDPAESALVEIYSDTDSSPDMRGYTDVNGQIEFT
ncbi:MAG: hypothetical protein DRN95_07785, partial [Candidatus Hydrothermarchaeota archaeon]